MTIDDAIGAAIEARIGNLGQPCPELERKVDILLQRQTPRLQYSPADAAELLGCSVRWLNTLEQQYGLKSYKIGGSRFYSHDDLVRFVIQQANQTAVSPSLN